MIGVLAKSKCPLASISPKRYAAAFRTAIQITITAGTSVQKLGNAGLKIFSE